MRRSRVRPFLSAAVPLTNLGDPVSNWTLTWSFGAEQQVTAWNATVSQSGSNALTTGFVGDQSGPGPSPASFTLNGTVCTTTYSS